MGRLGCAARVTTARCHHIEAQRPWNAVLSTLPGFFTRGKTVARSATRRLKRRNGHDVLVRPRYGLVGLRRDGYRDGAVLGSRHCRHRRFRPTRWCGSTPSPRSALRCRNWPSAIGPWCPVCLPAAVAGTAATAATGSALTPLNWRTSLSRPQSARDDQRRAVDDETGHCDGHDKGRKALRYCDLSLTRDRTRRGWPAEVR